MQAHGGAHGGRLLTTLPSYAAPDRPYRRSKRAPDRVAGWLRWYLRSSRSGIWCRLDFGHLGQRLHLSPRTIYRAKRYLMEHGDYYGLKFVTLHSGGRWQVLVALVDRLKYDELPLHYDKNGAWRRLRTWIFGVRHHPPGDLVTDRCYYRRDINSGKIYKRMAPQGEDKSKNGRSTDPGIQRRYHHALARHLGRLHWDNCKVRCLHGAIVGFVRRTLRAGIAPRHIIGAYYTALVQCHGMATDEGLSSGHPRLRYSGASTLARAYTALGFERVDTDRGVLYVKVHDLVF